MGSTTLEANLPPESTTPAVNFPTGDVVDAGDKFDTGVNDTGGKFETSGKLPPVSVTSAKNGISIRLINHKMKLKENICLYVNSTTQRRPNKNN
jgi:hypothetical protein